MNTIADYLHHPERRDCLTYRNARTLRTFRPENLDTQQYRIAKKLVDRGLLKPFGPIDPIADDIIQIGDKLYAVPIKWKAASTPAVSKRTQYIERSQNNAKHEAINFFAMRNVVEVIFDSSQRAEITTRDERGCNKKYYKKTSLVVPELWNAHARWSTNDFLILNKSRTEAVTDDNIHVCEVTGWWKSAIKGYAEHYPVKAWLAHDGKVRTITNSERTAIQGLRTRLTNRVLKTIAA